MAKRRKKKTPLWQTLIIIAALVCVGIATFLGISSMFREEVLKQNISTQKDYISILYVDYDDSYLTSQVMGENEFLTASISPEREGYTFSHWTSAGKNYTPTELFSINPVEDMIFTACYTPNTYTVTFDLTGYNTDQTSTKEVTFDQPLGETPVFQDRAGYTESWRDKYGNIYTEETLIKVAEDITLKPYYDPYKYTLNFYSPVNDYDLENGKFEFVGSKKYSYGDEITFDDYSILSYISEGRNCIWKVDGIEVSEGTNNFVDLSKYDNGATIEVYATWIAEKYTATFVLNNGEEDIVQEVEYNSTITMPEITKEGSVLRYWYYEEIIPGYFEKDPISGVITDTWVEEKVIIHYITELTFEYTLSADTTFYAEWGEGFLINLDYTDATVGIEDATIYSGIGVITALPVPGKENHSFLGWEDVETGTLYEDGICLYAESNVGKTFNFIAKWSTEKTITIKLNTYGENINNDFESVSFYRGWDCYELPIPERECYTFLGWSSDGETVDERFVNNERVITAYSSTIVGLWELV